MTQGLIHIYCGDGKGKSTAAAGLAVRAAGCGVKVLFARFLKNESSGELRILDEVPEIEVIHLQQSFGFYNTLQEKEKQQVKEVYEQLFHTIKEKVETNRYGMLVMDEFMAAYNYGLFSQDAALDFLQNKPVKLEVVMTGRNPGKELVDIADYVSEIKKVKHPFDIGVKARRGIEF
jgi:cob(I)alamin adenosyltransferase